MYIYLYYIIKVELYIESLLQTGKPSIPRYVNCKKSEQHVEKTCWKNLSLQTNIVSIDKKLIRKKCFVTRGRNKKARPIEKRARCDYVKSLGYSFCFISFSLLIFFAGKSQIGLSREGSAKRCKERCLKGMKKGAPLFGALYMYMHIVMYVFQDRYRTTHHVASPFWIIA